MALINHNIFILYNFNVALIRFPPLIKSAVACGTLSEDKLKWLGILFSHIL